MLLTLVLVQAVPASAAPAFRALLFTKTAAGAYRHDSIPAGVTMVEQLAAANNFEVTRTEDSSVFSATGLAPYDVIIMLQNSGMVWDTEAQRTAFQNYVRSGKGVVAVHNTTDMNIEAQFPWWDQVLMGGAHMPAHSATVQGTAKVADRVHPSTKGLPERWTRTEEWYNFDRNFRGDAHILVTADETTYDAGGSRMGHDHPISWCRNAEGGRIWATAMGHQASAYSEASFRTHVLGGVEWAAGAKPGDCGPTVANRYQKVTLDSQPAQPMGIDVANDGTVFYVERLGKVKMIRSQGGTNTTTTLATLNVYTGGEDGVIGVAADPNFSSNRRIFVNYSPAGSAEIVRVSRFTLNAAGTALDMASERKIIDIPAWRSPEPGHSGGNIEFGPGGNLYIGVGDDVKPSESSGYTPIDERPGRERFDAQGTSANTNDLRGKVLRIHPEEAGGYTIPSGNLFAPGTALTKPEIYVMGWRNPFRFNVDPLTGWISIADYGPDAGAANPNRGPEGTVEWNLIKEPGNYGWPYCIGPNTPFNDFNFATNTSGPKFNCAAPVNNSPNNTGLTNLPPARAATVWYDYHAGSPYPEMGTGGGLAPMGGPFYNYNAASTSERKFPEYYDKTPFFFEWSRNYIREMRLDAQGNLLKINNFAPNLDLRSPMDMDFGPDGAMYYLDWGIGWFEDHSDDGVYRVDYVNGNRSPIAKISGVPDSGRAPLQVAFSSAGSSDPDGDALTYAWDFDGNGTTDSTAANPTHTYTANGQFTARLTVRDPGGKTGSATFAVTVGNTRPTVIFDDPPNGGILPDNGTLSYRIRVTDPEDGTAIDCSRVSVLYAIGHDEHSHDVDTKSGCTGSFATNSGGHDPTSNFFHVLTAKYTDAGGLEGSSSAMYSPPHKQAEHFTSSAGIRVISQGGAENGMRVGDISNNDWIAFNPVSLRNITSLAFRVSTPNNNAGSIEVRAGSPTGTLVASQTIPSTGGWDNYVTLPSVPVTDPGGSQTLYFVFKTSGGGAPFDLDAIFYNGPGVSGPGGGGPENGSAYRLTAVHSGKAADVNGFSSADGASVLQWPVNAGTNQQWRFTDAGGGTFRLAAVHSGKCLDVTAASTADGALLNQWACGTGAHQRWRFESTGTPDVYRVVSVNSGKCLDVPNASTADSVQLVQWTCNSGTNQQWRLTKVS
ncbi:ThuA domain-containing protein [Actinocorallia sp. A-T 12471]|uniref:ThuA domain-containing protein n=1 Tax=Actinocorallia sp. A-T 12471 TaxID=3089813 RepID=UPI0029D04E35|nr:ThuA domain-containing protein [Actinocorallia sp. A-T 12471]MDX6742430.1 ThuA domain-containing protein [Actinocorallia sp. A-T 12471]